MYFCKLKFSNPYYMEQVVLVGKTFCKIESLLTTHIQKGKFYAE